MAIMIHLTDFRLSSKIRSNGIKPGKDNGVVFCMPVMPDFYISHQWLRELRRFNAKTFAAVYFKLPSEELIWFGHYKEVHDYISLSTALGLFWLQPNKLGYEFAVERKVAPHEIIRVKSLPKTIGWRYSPESHSVGLGCACPICIPRGSIKANRKRGAFADKEDPFLAFDYYMARIRSANKDTTMAGCIRLLKGVEMKRDPDTLRFAIRTGFVHTAIALAEVLPFFQAQKSKEMLLSLSSHIDERVREAAIRGLEVINRNFGS